MDKIAEQISDNREILDDKVQIVKERDQRNPVGKLERRFSDIQNYRQPWMDEAKKMAELVVPGMYEGSSSDSSNFSGKYIWGQSIFNTANQSLTGQGVMLLSWAMAEVILPANGQYFKRLIDARIAKQAEAMDLERKQQGLDPASFVPIHEQMNQELLADDRIVQQSIAASNHQEVLAACQFHTLISGLSVFGHLSRTEAKCYTIQNAVCVFDSMKEPVEVLVVDKIPIVDLPMSVRKRAGLNVTGVQDLDPSDQFATVYTQQIRVSRDKLKIFTEINGVNIPELEYDLPVEAPALIPVPFMFLNNADPYPTGWLTYNRGDCNSYENLSMSVEGMVQAAASAILGVPPSAKITSEELRQRRGLSVLPVGDGAKNALSIVTAPIAQNLQQVLGLADKKERRLMISFGMDFAIQRQGERVTAEEIQKLSQGLHKLFGATFKQNERSFQHKHCRREFSLCEEAGLVRHIPPDYFTMSLTTGLNEIQAQEDVQRMDSLIQRAGQFWGPMGLQSFSKDATLQWYANRFGVESDGVLMDSEQQAEQLGINQLIGVLKQLGPQGPAIAANLLTNMLQQQGG